MGSSLEYKPEQLQRNESNDMVYKFTILRMKSVSVFGIQTEAMGTKIPLSILALVQGIPISAPGYFSKELEITLCYAKGNW